METTRGFFCLFPSKQIVWASHLFAQEFDDDVAPQAEAAQIQPVPRIGKASVYLLNLQRNATENAS